jgi:hypothetical protein
VKPLAAIALALLAPACLATPATPSEACLRIAADLERAQAARKEALDKGDTAWKTVLPFAVIARKASSKAAADEADKRIAALRRQADTESCDAP